MKKISVWNPKGGQGKSMLSLNLAAAARKRGLSATVVCCDPQGTSTIYGLLGKLPFDILDHEPRSKAGCDILICDHMASLWQLPATSLLVMPFKPVRDQHVSYLGARRMAEEAGKQILSVVTDGDMRSSDIRNNVLKFQREGCLPVSASSAFGKAANLMSTIFDQKLNSSHNISQRRAEISQILDHVLRMAK